jgi:hypothetical protein
MLTQRLMSVIGCKNIEKKEKAYHYRSSLQLLMPVVKVSLM